MTGATGNTGSRVARLLVRSHPDRKIVALVRQGSDTREIEALGIRPHVCDLGVAESYLPAIEQDAVFLETANLRHARSMMPRLVTAGILRAYCVTTTAVFSTFHSYAAEYRAIEADLTNAPVPVTLLRPSMIYGNARDHNMHKLIQAMRRSPIYPVFGPGTALMQPVFVDDLASGIASAVDRGRTGSFNLAGPIPISYNELLRTVSDALGRHVRLVHVHHRLAASAARVLQSVPGFPVTHEQVMRLLEDKAFDISAAVADLDFTPRTFADGIREEVLSLPVA